jgi:hypothetical protein
MTDNNKSQTEHSRICEAYLEMAKKLNYRPAAPGDGMGGVSLTQEQAADQKRLLAEGALYAQRFITEEDTRKFWIGVSHWPHNRALVYTIQAARTLCSGNYNGWEWEVAAGLLEMAREEVLAEHQRELLDEKIQQSEVTR